MSKRQLRNNGKHRRCVCEWRRVNVQGKGACSGEECA